MSQQHRVQKRRWAAVRGRALNAAGWRCTKCGRPGRLEVHHVVPLHQGGAQFDMGNLRVLCKRCHLATHQRPRTPSEQAWDELVTDVSHQGR